MSREKQIESTDWLTRDIPKEQLEREKEQAIMSADLELCHTEFMSGVGEIYTDYDTTAQKMIAKGYRKQSENTVEVIRCKDCEYWTEVSFDAITEWHWGECRKPLGDYRDCDTAEHDFCSYGKAKMKGGAES